MTLLECKHLTKTFDRKTVLDDVSLKIEPGKIYGLLGKNGAGKTTLIKLINDLLTPTDGTILFKRKAIGTQSKAHISYLPERTYLDKNMRVSQAIKMFEDFYEDFDQNRAYKLLEDLDLDADSKISKMSKGMQEKLQLIFTERTNGKFVTEDQKLIAKYKKQLATAAAKAYLADTKRIGVSFEEAINTLQEIGGGR